MPICNLPSCRKGNCICNNHLPVGGQPRATDQAAHAQRFFLYRHPKKLLWPQKPRENALWNIALYLSTLDMFLDGLSTYP